MQSTHPHVNSISDLATGNGNDATPFSQQSVVLTKQAYIELTWKANYWQAQHAQSVEREAALTAKVASLEATVRDLTQRLYGTKSEKSAGPDEAAESPASRLRHRRQQPGSKGHGRSARSALLIVPEGHDLSPAQLCCPACVYAFEPVMTKLYERQMREKRFHGDEARWEVFEDVDGKTGHRWYLWVMQSASVVFYRMAPGRGADVPTAHFAKLHKDLVDVVLVCDRYSAYKCLAKACDDLILAFCWAHVRRDFLKAARSWPGLVRWMFVWIEAIRELYRLNAARLEVWDETLPLALQPSAFAERHHDLETKLSQMRACYQAHLQEPSLHLAKQKVLRSLRTHWEGLTVFVGRPEVAMDNNTAERTLRNPVVGRKNYYGSGSVWSAHLAARIFSVLQTVLLWGLNPHHWLSTFLQACAENGGTCPTDLSAFLPWHMTPERREELARPAPVIVSPLTPGAQAEEETEAVDTS